MLALVNSNTVRTFTGLPNLNTAQSILNPGNLPSLWSSISCRTIVKNYMPRPKESKRQKFSWRNRMKTHGGRAIIMRRMLKGRYILSQPTH